MSKRDTLYYDKFVYCDFMADLQRHPLAIRGAWITILCELWASYERGSLTLTLVEWATVLGVEPAEAEALLRYIKWRKIGDIEATIKPPPEGPLAQKDLGSSDGSLSFSHRGAIVRNRIVTPEKDPYLTQEIDILCRRMVRDEKVRKNAAQRAADHRYREKKKREEKEGEPEGRNASVTQPSQGRDRDRDRDRDNKDKHTGQKPEKALSKPPRSNGTDKDGILNKTELKDFDLFWDVYPRKRKKKECKEAWKVHISAQEVVPSKVVDDVNARKSKDDQWRRGYVPYPTSYLRGHLWEDELEDNKDDVRFNNL